MGVVWSWAEWVLFGTFGFQLVDLINKGELAFDVEEGLEWDLMWD